MKKNLPITQPTITVKSVTNILYKRLKNIKRVKYQSRVLGLLLIFIVSFSFFIFALSVLVRHMTYAATYVPGGLANPAIQNSGDGSSSACASVKVGNPSDPLPDCTNDSGGGIPPAGGGGGGGTGACEAGTDLGDADGYQDGVLKKITLCRVQGIEVNSQIAENVDRMLTLAKRSGLVLTGGGFRSMAEQKALYANNCRSRRCSPPTARPGYSNHQMGLAIDFLCNGSLITSHNNKCFSWLASNASSFGLKNFYKEPWHWSVNGR